jgi:hypothetical protein
MISLRPFIAQCLCALAILMPGSAALAAPLLVPPCRLDNSSKALVESTLTRAAAAFKEIGKPLPFDGIKFNEPADAGKNTLVAYVVSDANEGGVSAQGCSQGQPQDRPATRSDQRARRLCCGRRGSHGSPLFGQRHSHLRRCGTED